MALWLLASTSGSWVLCYMASKYFISSSHEDDQGALNC
jgi:hypothetical protein